MPSPRIALLLALVAACSGNPDPVPVIGAEADLRALSGEWTGEYGSSESARSGSIVFRLQAGSDTAAGDVVMIPSGSRAALHPVHGPDVSEQSIPPSQLLTIRFVGIEEGRVTGELQPYHDPGCDCALHTTFTGTLQADTISGTYRSSRPGSARPATGWWRVTRR